MINIIDLTKRYGDRTVLNIEKLELVSGKIYAILGPNGAGKSTFLKILSGIDREFEGNCICDMCCSRAFMPQKPYIFNLSVLENALLCKKSQVNIDEHKQMAVEMLKSIGLGKFIHTNAKTLSGGEAQRLMLVRTLLYGAKLTVLDEPTSAIDLESLEYLHSIIRDYHRKHNGSIIFSTHNPSEAFKLADEVIIFYNGKVVEAGRTKDVFENPSSSEGKVFINNWRV